MNGLVGILDGHKLYTLTIDIIISYTLLVLMDGLSWIELYSHSPPLYVSRDKAN